LSTTYSVNAQTLINSVLRLQGWLDYTQTADATKLANMLEALNIMIKAWSARGIKLWCIENITIPLVSGQAAYTIGPTGNVVADRPLRFEAAPTINNTSAGTVTELFCMSRQEYLTLGNPSSPGVPSNYFYDDLIPNGVLYLYVTPDANTASTNTVKAPIRRYISDILTLTDNFDFPAEWYQAIRWGLAAETSMENQCPESKAAGIEVKSDKFLEIVEGWDREWASLSFAPDRRGQGYGSASRP